MVLRRSRGLAPGAVAALPTTKPILAVGGDLKNAVTVVVDGQAYCSQHIGDLSQGESRRAFRDTIEDLLAMYAIAPADLTVVHDRHPEYASTVHAVEMAAGRTIAVQHHHAHVASVLAERGDFDRHVLGIAFDGTGYGDDGGIWGGEFFVGSVRAGFTRVAHLRQAQLAGGDAAARHPVQAAAGFVSQLERLPDLSRRPFCFPEVFEEAAAVLQRGIRVFPTTSVGRLFDSVAALVGLNLLFVAAVFALAMKMPGWVAALVVGGVVLLVAAVLGSIGWSRRVTNPLAMTRKTLKEDVQWAKERVA